MPRDVESLAPLHDASAEPFQDARHGGDAGILAILGVFTMIDAVLVLLCLM